MRTGRAVEDEMKVVEKRQHNRETMASVCEAEDKIQAAGRRQENRERMVSMREAEEEIQADGQRVQTISFWALFTKKSHKLKEILATAPKMRPRGGVVDCFTVMISLFMTTWTSKICIENEFTLDLFTSLMRKLRNEVTLNKGSPPFAKMKLLSPLHYLQCRQFFVDI